jgi:HEAT repeat protein
LESDQGRVLEGTTLAVRESYDEPLVTALVNFFHDTEKSPTHRLAALELIAPLHHQQPGWKGQWWAYHPALEPPPAKTETWLGTTLVLKTLRESLRESNPDLRRACIEGLAAARDTNSAPALRDIFPHETNPASRATILRALGALKDPDTLRLVVGELKERHDPGTTAAAIAAAEDIGGDQAIKILSAFLSSSNAEATPRPSRPWEASAPNPRPPSSNRSSGTPPRPFVPHP